MIVLKIIGWILLGVIALVVLVLCIRVRLRLEYSHENTSVILKYLFLNLKIYPMEKKEKKPKPPGEPKEEQHQEEKQEPAQKKEKNGDSLLKTIYDAEGTDGIIEIIKKVLSYTKTFFGGSVRAFIIDELYLDICCTRSDAAQTAIYYGEVCAVLFPLLGGLISKYRVKKYDVRVYPDFIARFSDANFEVTVHFTPIRLIGVGTAYVLKLVFGVFAGLLLKIFGASKAKKSVRNENTKIKEMSEIK